MFKSSGIWAKDGSFKGRAIITKSGDYREVDVEPKKKGRGTKKQQNTEITDKRLIDFCLNCKKPTCKYGDCPDYDYYKFKLQMEDKNPPD